MVFQVPLFPPPLEKSQNSSLNESLSDFVWPTETLVAHFTDKGVYDKLLSVPCIPLVPSTRSYKTLHWNTLHLNMYTFIFPSEKHRANMQHYLDRNSDEMTSTDPATEFKSQNLACFHAKNLTHASPCTLFWWTVSFSSVIQQYFFLYWKHFTLLMVLPINTVRTILTTGAFLIITTL